MARHFRSRSLNKVLITVAPPHRVVSLPTRVESTWSLNLPQSFDTLRHLTLVTITIHQSVSHTSPSTLPEGNFDTCKQPRDGTLGSLVSSLTRAFGHYLTGSGIMTAWLQDTYDRPSRFAPTQSLPHWRVYSIGRPTLHVGGCAPLLPVVASGSFNSIS